MNVGAKRRVLAHDLDRTSWRDRAALAYDDQADALGALLAHLDVAEQIADHRRDTGKLTATRSYIGLVREWVSTITAEAAALRAAGDDRRRPDFRFGLAPAGELTSGFAPPNEESDE